MPGNFSEEEYTKFIDFIRNEQWTAAIWMVINRVYEDNNIVQVKNDSSYDIANRAVENLIDIFRQANAEFIASTDEELKSKADNAYRFFNELVELLPMHLRTQRNS